MKTIRKKSALPLYIAAACWLVYGLIFPLYKLWHFLPILAISLAAYLIAAKKCPDKVIQVEDKLPKTGDALLDQIVADQRKYATELRSLNAAIDDPLLSEQMARMETSLNRIVEHVVAHPEKAPQIRRFMNYYLPTSVKLLSSYEQASAQGVQGENIRRTMQSVRQVMGTVTDAFDRQLDSLFEDVALDISTDITVLENMMAAEGLSDNKGGINHG